MIDESRSTSDVVLPWTGTEFDVSFGHSKENASGLQIEYMKRGSGFLIASCRPKTFHSNFPGATHGGLVACALDEVMGQSVFVETGALAVSLEANFEWLKSTPVNDYVLIKSKIIHKFGRFYFVIGEVASEDNKVYARSRGLYFQPTSSMMAKMLGMNKMPVEAKQWFK